MTLSTWLLYVAAVLILTGTPGPSVLMCVSTSVKLGARQALIASLGSTTAIVSIMVLSAIGLGTALAASEALFTALKWLGAAYLAYLGIASFFSSATDIAVSGSVESSTSERLFAQGFLVGVSNPKALLFFGALFPQFIVPSAPQVPQFLILGVTFIFLSSFGSPFTRSRHPKPSVGSSSHAGQSFLIEPPVLYFLLLLVFWPAASAPVPHDP